LKDFDLDDYRTLLKTLQAKSTVIALSNNEISKRYGPFITSTIQTDDVVDSLGPDVKNFSVRPSIFTQIFITNMNFKINY
jgi:hypothetical protein